MNVRHDMVQCYVVRPGTALAGAGTASAAPGKDGSPTGFPAAEAVPPSAGVWQFLQLRRAKHDYLGGIWHTVAGGIEQGETAVAAVVREMREESGLAPQELYCLDRIGSFYVPDLDTLWHSVLFCAIVAPDAQVQLNEEHDAFRWLAAEAAAEEFLWPNDREAVVQIRREILADGLAKQYMRVKLSL